MAKRDPEKTARNKRVEKLSGEMEAILGAVLEETGCTSLLSLNAKIGSKHEELVNVKHRCIRGPDEFLSLYMDGLARRVKRTPPGDRPGNAYFELAKWYQTITPFRSYMEKFLERSTSSTSTNIRE